MVSATVPFSAARAATAHPPHRPGPSHRLRRFARRAARGGLVVSTLVTLAVSVIIALLLTPGPGPAFTAVLLGSAVWWAVLVLITDGVPVGPTAEPIRTGLLASLGSAAVGGVYGALIAPLPVPHVLLLQVLLLTAAHSMVVARVQRLRGRDAHPASLLIGPADLLQHQPLDPDDEIRGFAEPLLHDAEIVARTVLADVRRGGHDHVEILPGVPPDVVDELAWTLRQDGVPLMLRAPAGPVRRSRLRLAIIDGRPAMLVTSPLPGLPSRLLKRGLDLAGASTLLLLLAPLLLATAIAIRIDDRGPVLFRQERIGKDGEPFKILKFRSMRVNADAQLQELLRRQNTEGTPLFKVSDDPRITRLGSILRSTSIDELPQLLNVVGGSMSLVGPRPQRAEEVELYTGSAPHRLGVRPGMTGLWQVSGRSSLTWEEAQRLDVEYAHNWTAGMDIEILLRTPRAVFSRDGAV
ncbi:MAG: sugar transferase [Brachybacterium sp.]|nr:sugar transferase [Brachybacterium sp.]